MSSARSEHLADRIRELSPSVAIEVTDLFLDRHPNWRVRYGARAVSHGIQDAGYHLAFLAASVEGSEPVIFASYARWAAGVLAARGIGVGFLSENIAELERALGGRLNAEGREALAPHIRAALAALTVEPDFPPAAPLGLTADIFLQALLTGQRQAAAHIAREALRAGTPLQELYVDVFQPALYEIGARWEANRLTVAQEHMATAITQYVMAQIYVPPEDHRAPRGNVVLTGVEGELHNIGAVMVSDLLELGGWRVRFLGTNLPASSILDLIRDTRPTHVGISATMVFNVSAVRALIASIRAEFSDQIRVFVGGAAFRTVPDLWRQVAADAHAPDLRGAQSLFDARP